MVKIDTLDLEKVFVIAEAGVNHNGDFKIAKELIDAAAKSGADAIKFQNFRAERVISKYAKKAKYQLESSKDKVSQLSMLKKLELKDSDYIILKEYAMEREILFLSTPKDIFSVQLLEEIDIPIYKIGSTEINNFEFLEYIALTKKTIILSTGMSTLSEVKEAIGVIRNKSKAQLILLHCVSEYPCPINQVNLRAMLTLENEFNLPIGYSDHTLGTDVIFAAVALGAKVIEKHFTVDREMKGPDQAVSIEPKELKDMICSIRNIEKCMGNGIKIPALCEIKNRKLLRRGLVFTNDIEKGSIVSLEDFTIKRPGLGLDPKYKASLQGRRLKRSVSEDQPVQQSLFE
jgi:N,N'-diacetyllegionaminate synthase